MEKMVLVQNEWLDLFKLYWKSSAPCNLTSKTEFYKFNTILITAHLLTTLQLALIFDSNYINH